MKLTVIIGVLVAILVLAWTYARNRRAASAPAAAPSIRHEDLAFLCDANEAYFRAEASVLVKHDPSWAVYMDALLSIRLADLQYQRRQLENLPRDERLPVKLANDGWCALQIGDNQTFRPPDDLAGILQEYERHHPNAWAEYISLIKRWREEIIRESGIDKAKWNTIGRRYFPLEADENSPDQAPLRMPVGGTPAADAPVAPPPGIAGR